MNKYEGKYYFLNDTIIHIKTIHPQSASATCLVEVDDYAGNIFKSLHNNWILNNNNVMAEFSDYVLVHLKEATEDEFLHKLQCEIEDSIGQIKQGIGYCTTYFKKTDMRQNLLKKHYKIP